MLKRHKRGNQEIFEEQETTNFVLDLLDRSVSKDWEKSDFRKIRGRGPI